MKIHQILEADINSYRAGDNRNPRSPDYDESYDAAEDPSGYGTKRDPNVVFDESSQTNPKTGWTQYTGDFATPEAAQAVATSIKQGADQVGEIRIGTDQTEDGPVYMVYAEYRFWQGKDLESEIERNNY